MSAVNVIVQRSAAYVMTDGLLYMEGEVASVNFCKCIPLKNARAAVAGFGPASFLYLAATVLDDYPSFDAIVALGSTYFDELFNQYLKQGKGDIGVAALFLVGWKESENRPACYAIEFEAAGAKSEWVRNNNPTAREEDICRALTELPTVAAPMPAADDLVSSGWPIGIDPGSRDVELDLLHLIELQRRKVMDDGKYYVGGEALLTTIRVDSVSQRVVHRWGEDTVGQQIVPRPIDWTTWRRQKR